MLKLIAPEVGGVKDSAGPGTMPTRSSKADRPSCSTPLRSSPRRMGSSILTHAPRRPRLRRRRHGAPEVPRLLGGRHAPVRKGGRGGSAGRGVHPAQDRRRLRQVRRRLPQAPLLGPRGAPSANRFGRIRGLPSRRRQAPFPTSAPPRRTTPRINNMAHSRRSVLSGIALALPFGLGARVSAGPIDAAPALRFRPFEEAVREAFASGDRASSCRRIEVGPSEQVRAGVQGCHNDRPFAGFPAGI